MDLGLEAGRRFEVPMPLASMTRDLVQSMMGAGMTEEDFSTLLLQQARASGIELKPEDKAVGRRTVAIIFHRGLSDEKYDRHCCNGAGCSRVPGVGAGLPSKPCT